MTNHFKSGDWNAICDRCGFKYKASELKEEWTGFMVCEACWEPRHPLDFLRGEPEDTSVDWARPEVEDSGGTDINGNSTIFTPTSETQSASTTITWGVNAPLQITDGTVSPTTLTFATTGATKGDTFTVFKSGDTNTYTVRLVNEFGAVLFGAMVPGNRLQATVVFNGTDWEVDEYTLSPL